MLERVAMAGGVDIFGSGMERLDGANPATDPDRAVQEMINARLESFMVRQMPSTEPGGFVQRQETESIKVSRAIQTKNEVTGMFSVCLKDSAAAALVFSFNLRFVTSTRHSVTSTRDSLYAPCVNKI
jgi:hypothetical protein